jgi:hypothetical protein
MPLLEKLIHRDTVEIATTPEKIWDFAKNLEAHYKAWHPEDHILFKWTKGEPMTEGAKVYGEEIVGGKLLKLSLTCRDVVPYRSYSFKFSFPLSLFVRYDYIIEPRGDKTAFTAITVLHFPRFARKKVERVMRIGAKHVREEGENMKRLIESGEV